MAAEASPTRPARRWLRWLLIGSLGLNLLLVGIWAGAFLGAHGHAPGRPNDVAWPYVQALEPQDRRALGGALRARMRAAGVDRTLRRDGYREAVALLRQEQIDRAALEMLLSRQFSGAARLQAEGRAVLLEQLEAMSPSARRAYADRLEATLNRRKERWGNPTR